MGEASRRGTFAERKIKAIERNENTVNAVLEKCEKEEFELTMEEKQKRSHAKRTILRFMTYARQSGLSMKEIRRGMKRHIEKAK